MHFPIFYGFIAPDIAQAKAFQPFKAALDLAEKAEWPDHGCGWRDADFGPQSPELGNR